MSRGVCTYLGHRCGERAAQSSIKVNRQLKDTHRVHVDGFQIIQVRIIRLFGMVRIEFARNLKELLPEVGEKPTWRDYKWTIGAMSRPPTRNFVRLYLRVLNRRP